MSLISVTTEENLASIFLNALRWLFLLDEGNGESGFKLAFANSPTAFIITQLTSLYNRRLANSIDT